MEKVCKTKNHDAFLICFLFFFLHFLVCLFHLCFLLLTCECNPLSAFLFQPNDPGFWMISTSDDDVPELRSYENNGSEEEFSDENEKSDEEMAREGNEFGEEDEPQEEESEQSEKVGGEENSDADESENDLEVMEILGQDEAQQHIQKDHQPIVIARDDSKADISEVNSSKIILKML